MSNLIKTCFLSVSVLLLCPKRSLTEDEPEWPFPVRLQHHNKIVLGNNAGLKGIQEERGFDLTTDEMAKFKIWPQGVIPYFIDDFSFDKVLRDRIRGFLEEVNSLTGLNFMELPRPPKDQQERWVFFINRRMQLGSGDHSVLNYTNSGVQKVVVGYEGLVDDGELAEAILALVGVPAQHNAPDRNKYIIINDENIQPDKKKYFTQLRDDEWLFHDLAYDFQSASHYPTHKYSVNGKATIVPRNYETIGESKGLSYMDALKIRMLYIYIQRKDEDKTPDCKKLFEPGENFRNFRPLKQPTPKARPKPSKYTGVVTDDNKEDNNENNEKSPDELNSDEKKEPDEVLNNENNEKNSPVILNSDEKKDPAEVLGDEPENPAKNIQPQKKGIQELNGRLLTQSNVIEWNGGTKDSEEERLQSIKKKS